MLKSILGIGKQTLNTVSKNIGVLFEATTKSMHCPVLFGFGVQRTGYVQEDTSRVRVLVTWLVGMLWNNLPLGTLLLQLFIQALLSHLRHACMVYILFSFCYCRVGGVNFRLLLFLF